MCVGGLYASHKSPERVNKKKKIDKGPIHKEMACVRAQKQIHHEQMVCTFHWTPKEITDSKQNTYPQLGE